MSRIKHTFILPCINLIAEVVSRHGSYHIEGDDYIFAGVVIYVCIPVYAHAVARCFGDGYYLVFFAAENGKRNFDVETAAVRAGDFSSFI